MPDCGHDQGRPAAGRRVGARDALTHEKVRRAAGVAARNTGNAASVALALPAHDAEHVRAVADGFVSGAYSFKRYKSGPTRPVWPTSRSSATRPVARTRSPPWRAARTVGDLVNRARDWVNTPPNDLTPELFADAVVALGKELTGGPRSRRSTSRCSASTELEELGCGGILGVGQGSANGPRLVKLDLGSRGRARQHRPGRQGRSPTTPAA